LGRPRERRPLFGGVYVLVPIWLGAPRPAWRPDPLVERGPAGFLGRYLVTVESAISVQSRPIKKKKPHTSLDTAKTGPGGLRPWGINIHWAYTSRLRALGAVAPLLLPGQRTEE